MAENSNSGGYAADVAPATSSGTLLSRFLTDRMETLLFGDDEVLREFEHVNGNERSKALADPGLGLIKWIFRNCSFVPSPAITTRVFSSR